MHIQCTNRTAIVDTLDHLPPIPLLLDYRCSTGETITKQDESGIYRALPLRDRLRQIILYLPPSILHKCLVYMDGCFPMLEYLSLWSVGDRITAVTLPKAFLAPNLRHLEMPGIGRPPKRLRLLTSTASLRTLMLWNIETSGYFRPRLLAARLSCLPQLKVLVIGFSMPIPRPSTEMEMLGEQGTPVILYNLNHLKFRGVSAYLESLVTQIMTPLLKQLDVMLYNQIAFSLPHLSHFINITETLKLPTVKIFFGQYEVFIVTFDHHSIGPFRLCVLCTQLDLQIHCAAQICSALIPRLSGVERIVLDFYDEILPTEWQNSEIESTTWHELLRPFIGVKELHIEDGLLNEVSRALQVDEVESDPGFLPNLQQIFAERNLFASFIDIRQVMDIPVQFMGPTSTAFPKLQRNKGPRLLEPKEPENPLGESKV